MYISLKFCVASSLLLLARRACQQLPQLLVHLEQLDGVLELAGVGAPVGAEDVRAARSLKELALGHLPCLGLRLERLLQPVGRVSQLVTHLGQQHESVRLALDPESGWQGEGRIAGTLKINFIRIRIVLNKLKFMLTVCYFGGRKLKIN